MKTCLLVAALAVGLEWTTSAQTDTLQAPRELERGANYRLWEAPWADPTNPERVLTNRYTELGSGLHYLNNGRWANSQPVLSGLTSIRRTASQHQTVFPQFLGARGVIGLTTSAGQALPHLPLALGYYDAATGRAVLLSALSSAPEPYGTFVWPTTNLYMDCFAPVRADVQYVSSLAGLEQDVILRENPPSPAEYGLNPQTTRLEIWTEFFSPPAPTRTPRVIKPASGSEAGLSLVESNLVDELIDFGPMMMVSGGAFAVGDTTGVQRAAVPVAKRWLVAGQRTFLIEAVEYPAISNALAALPPAPAFTPGTVPTRTALIDRLQPGSPGQVPVPTGPRLLAAQRVKDRGSSPGVVVDYLMVNVQRDFTFRGDMTYHISSPLFLAGNTTLEGGAVIKFTNDARIHVVGTLNCRTAPYRPAVFTSFGDDSVGVPLPGTRANLTAYPAEPALALEGGNALRHVRFRHARTALAFLGGSGYAVSHAQIERCLNGFQPLAAEAALRNILVAGTPSVLNGSQATVRGEHWTVDQAQALDSGWGNAIYLTNSLLVAVAQPSTLTAATATRWIETGEVFQFAGNGAHYLPLQSPWRDAGDPGIDPELARELRERTTEAPLPIEVDLSEAAQYGPRVAPDTGLPDLGYHYERLDYVWRSVRIGAPLRWLPGVAMGLLDADGPLLAPGASLTSAGTALGTNVWVRCASVQESAGTTNAAGASSGWIRLAAGNPASLSFTHTALLGLAEGAERASLTVGDAAWGTWTALNSRFENLRIGPSAPGGQAGLTNSLFRYDTVELGAGSGPLELQFWNNLVVQGRLIWGETTPGSAVFDSLFDQVEFQLPAVPPANGHNGYVAQNPLGGGQSDVVLGSFAYAAGPRGEYYQVSHELEDAGSRPAPAAGLAESTTRAEEAPEGASTVDIGLHYPLSGPVTHYAPYFHPVADQTVDEMTLLSVPLPAGDTNTPPRSIRFEMVSAPVGVQVQDTTLTWVPTEEQGPGTYFLTVAVYNDDQPSLSATQTFGVVVREVNRPPTLTAPPDATALAGQPFQASFAATDPDWPLNHVVFSLLSAPPGVSLDETTGVVTWTPAVTQAPRTHTLTVVATDDGTPSLSATQSFNVAVAYPPSPYTTTAVVELARDADQKTWETTVAWRTPGGDTALGTNRFVELQTGWHRWENGLWVPASEALSPTPGGGVQGSLGRHQAQFPLFLTLENGVRVTMADGQELRCTPVALGYYDAASGQSVLLSSNRLRTLLWTNANQAVYSNAFDRLEADLVYTYTVVGLEQDLVLRQNPPDPAVFGLDPQTTRLEVWTDVSASAAPRRTARALKATPVNDASVVPAEAQWTDEHLDFGPMAMVCGNAFGLGTQSTASALVAKRWIDAGGRTYLIESVEYPAVSQTLTTLPSSAPLDPLPMPYRTAAIPSALRPKQDHAASANLALASAASPSGSASAAGPGGGRALAIDFLLVNQQRDFVFRGDTTYLVSGPAYLGGTTVFEAGTVIKYAPGAKLHLCDVAQVRTTPCRPAVFTARDDDSVGCLLPGSTGRPEGYYAAPALALEGSNALVHVRVRYARDAFELLGGDGYQLTHAQIGDSAVGLRARAARAAVRNVLFDGVSTIFDGEQGAIRAEHLTVDQALTLNRGTDVRLYLTNCLLAAVAYGSNITEQVAVRSVPTSAVFQKVGAGAHYLPSGSPYRNQGSTDLEPGLAADLAQRTTEAPVVLSGSHTEPAVYRPVVRRGGAPPDLGYHYAPLDYLWDAAQVGAPTLCWQGVAMAVQGPDGLILTDGALLVSEGTPQTPNRWVRSAAVQERASAEPVPTLGRGGLLASAAVSSDVPVQFRFTEVAGGGGGPEPLRLLGGSEASWDLALCDSRLDCLNLVLNNAGSRLCLTNTHLWRSVLEMAASDSALTLHMYNNLLEQSVAALGLLASGSAMCDNVFDHSTLSEGAGLTHGHNAYVACTPLAGGVNDRALESLTYLAGPFGDRYQADPQLLDAGSRPAAEAGLWHYTTRPDGAKEANTQVDIGLHYVATKYAFDSEADFSGVQGRNHWFERFTDDTGAALGYLPDYAADLVQWWGSGDYFCLVTPRIQHPGERYDAVRSFVAPFAGSIRIDSSATKAPYGGLTDGVRLRIRKNQEVLAEGPNLVEAYAMWKINLTTSVRAGDALDFQLNRQGNNEGDTTFWHVGLEYLDRPATRWPSDVDGDGIPDYLEDRDGHGESLDGAASWLVADASGAAAPLPRLFADATAGGSAPDADRRQLAYWGFDQADLASDLGDPPLLATNLTLIPSFNGQALRFGAADRAVLRLRERAANGGGLNFAVANSTLRFYYRPAWTSAADRGQGPGAEACLLSLGDPRGSAGGYRLTVDAAGNQLTFLTGDGRGPVWQASGAIHWFSNTWYQISLSVGSASGRLGDRVRVTVFDTLTIDQTAANAIPLPTAMARLNGLCVGSAGDGQLPALGAIDEIESFNYDLGELSRRMNNLVMSARLLPGDPYGARLRWFRGANGTYEVQRRLQGDPLWTPLGRTTAWSFNDPQTNLLAGRRYDYQIVPVGSVPGNNQLTLGVALPPVHWRGKVLVLVDATLAADLATSLNEFVADLRGDGWTVSRYVVPRHDDAAWATQPVNPAYIRDVAAVKDLIRAEYALTPNDLKQVILVGHVAIPYSGDYAEDGHNSPPGDVGNNHQGAWPADAYYGDMLGVWTDQSVSRTNTFNPILQNLPGDGKWDTTFLAGPLQLAVGRIDFAKLPAFLNPPSGVAPRTEKDLIVQYFAKSRRYRHKAVSWPSRAMVGGYYAGVAEGDNLPVYQTAAINFSRWFGFDSWSLYAGDCFTSAQPLLWGFQGAPSLNDTLDFLSATPHRTADLVDPAKEPRVGFYVLGGSFFGDWNWGQDNFLRAVLATPQYGLASCWVRGGIWRFEALALGDSLGDGLLRTANDPTQQRSARVTFLMGDPTLRLHVLAPPRQLRASGDAQAPVTLSWTPSQDSGASYFVYRLTGAGDLARPELLTPEPVSGNSFTDPSPPNGLKTYSVRAALPTLSASGSYTNLSQAVFIRVP